MAHSASSDGRRCFFFDTNANFASSYMLYDRKMAPPGGAKEPPASGRRLRMRSLIELVGRLLGGWVLGRLLGLLLRGSRRGALVAGAQVESACPPAAQPARRRVGKAGRPEHARAILVGRRPDGMRGGGGYRRCPGRQMRRVELRCRQGGRTRRRLGLMRGRLGRRGAGRVRGRLVRTGLRERLVRGRLRRRRPGRVGRRRRPGRYAWLMRGLQCLGRRASDRFSHRARHCCGPSTHR
jgi:hypothetical protein